MSCQSRASSAGFDLNQPFAQREGFCHFKNLFSSNVTKPYNIKARAINVNTATNTIGVSYWKSPNCKRKPSPSWASTSSPTIAPITDNVAPISRPPKNTGKDAGTSTFHKICSRKACSEFIRSYNAVGTALTPTIVFTSTGKNTINAQTTTFERIPSPSQMTSNGAIATTGIAWLATRYGDNIFSSERD